MANATLDLSGIREQILSNVSMAFPRRSPLTGTPTIHHDNNWFTILLRRGANASYQAIAVDGPTKKVVAKGPWSAFVTKALESLLDVTSRMIDDSLMAGDIKDLNLSDAVEAGGGAYLYRESED